MGNRKLRLVAAAVLATTLSTSMVHAQSITVVNNGGSVTAAFRDAYYKPWTAATGITVVDDTFNQELAKIRTTATAAGLVCRWCV